MHSLKLNLRCLLRSHFLWGLWIFVGAACVQAKSKPVKIDGGIQFSEGKRTNQYIETEEGSRLHVLSRSEFGAQQEIHDDEEPNEVQEGPSFAIPTDSLVVGIPRNILAREHIFGGVVTKVSNRTEEDLGILKLSSLPPMNVNPELDEEQSELVLMGCIEDCSEGSTENQEVFRFPLLRNAGGAAEDLIYVDFTGIGEGMNVAQAMDPEEMRLVTESSRTVAVDYSQETLIFDVQSVMRPRKPNGVWEQTLVTTRWYLRLQNFRDPQYVIRRNVPGVGFFETDRAEEPLVERFPLNDSEGNPQNIKYFVLNVPGEFQNAFEQAFVDWNEVFEEEIGRSLLEYEFVNAGDERLETLIPGDIRINAMEWDEVNKAPYGGYGPHIADQRTGQVISANVLVQGPDIVELYSDWYEVSQDVHALAAVGAHQQAEVLRQRSKERILRRLEARRPALFTLKIGKLVFKIGAQDNKLFDPMMDTLHFDLVPEDMTYEEYMYGYFREMVAHELGHNLGLRHNFRGSLYAQSDDQPGEVSISVMEYLGRPFRHLNLIGMYDRLALRFGYEGLEPTERDLFCTDEDVADMDFNFTGRPGGNPECSRNDASSDPFSYFHSKLERVADLLIARGAPEAPEWSLSSMSREYTESLEGLLFYSILAQDTMRDWTHFFEAPGRPEQNLRAVQAYVHSEIVDVLCNEALDQDIRTTKRGAARTRAEENLEALRTQSFRKINSHTSENIQSCN